MLLRRVLPLQLRQVLVDVEDERAHARQRRVKPRVLLRLEHLVRELTLYRGRALYLANLLLLARRDGDGDLVLRSLVWDRSERRLDVVVRRLLVNVELSRDRRDAHAAKPELKRLPPSLLRGRVLLVVVKQGAGRLRALLALRDLGHVEGSPMDWKAPDSGADGRERDFASLTFGP